MTRGDMITIRMDEKKRPAAKGDIAQLSYSVDGEVIPVGTWRVSTVKEDGMVEAEPVEIEGKPNIGMDAVLFAREGRPEAAGKKEPSPEEKGSTVSQQPAQTGREEISVEKEAKPKSIEETLASYSKAAVPITFYGLGESVPCESGTARIHREKIEMTASGDKNKDYCTLRMSDTNLENFYATVKVSVNTASHNDFIIGIIYGDKSGDSIKTDSVSVTISADVQDIMQRLMVYSNPKRPFRPGRCFPVFPQNRVKTMVKNRFYLIRNLIRHPAY